MKNKIINIIITGTGGQGVITLSNMIRELAVLNKMGCEGATFKGGAQRMGTVYSELRLQLNPNKEWVISSQIPSGEVDILMGLEPWETLRFAKNCHAQTKVITNSIIEKLYIERMNQQVNKNPVDQLKKLFNHVIVADYTAQSIQEKGTKKAANLFLLKAALQANYLPFSKDQLKTLK